MTDTAAKFSEYAHPEKLVSTQWVADHVDDEDVVVLESNEDALLYSTGHIPGARHVPRGYLESRIEGAVPDRSADVVLYCASGNRSALAADTLQQMGYRNVSSMSEGFRGWVNAGGPVEG